MRTLVTALFLTLGLGATGCGGGNACDQAYDKLKSCWSSVDCTKQPDALSMTACTAAKTAFNSSTPTTSCEGQAKTLADQVNSCTLDSSKNCACK